MHHETEFDRKRLRKNAEECYVESKLKDDTVNLVVTTAGLSPHSKTEQTFLLLSRNKLVINNLS